VSLVEILLFQLYLIATYRIFVWGKNSAAVVKRALYEQFEAAFHSHDI
jgi:hypothetical protein